MSSDQELDPDELPEGQTPIWIQPPEDASQIEMMERHNGSNLDIWDKRLRSFFF